MNIEHFHEISKNKVWPIIFYLLFSFVGVFIQTLEILFVLYTLFLLFTYLIFDYIILRKAIIISFLVISLIGLITTIFNLSFSRELLINLLYIAIPLSILITSAIVVFLFIPTYQLYCLASVLKSKRATLAILAGFRIFPLFLDFSKKVFIALKIKGQKINIKTIFIFFENIIIEFFQYLDEYIKRISSFITNK